MNGRRKCNGAKIYTEAQAILLYWVGERRMIGRSVIVRRRGRDTSENAGMSSENYVRIIMAENLRFPGEGSSAQGKSGAKARPRGVVDAQTVEIPLPPKLLSTGTQEDSLTALKDMCGVRERK